MACEPNSEAFMRNYRRLALILGMTALLPGSIPAQTKREAPDKGVQEAIAFQRAKDRADAAQARKEARHPEKFTYAPPQPTSDQSEANQQKRDALERSKQESAPPQQR
jgi:hypothetical protein